MSTQTRSRTKLSWLYSYKKTSFPKIQTVLKRASREDFWFVSGTKWLNRPYKTGIVVVTATILLLG